VCHYIRVNSFILTTLGYTLSVYQRKQFNLHQLLVSVCQCNRGNSFLFIFSPAHCPFIRHNIFFLTQFLLHCVSISQPVTFSWRSVGYNLSAYQTQQFFPHPLFVSVFYYMRDIIFILYTVGYIVTDYQKQKYYSHLLLFTHCHYVRYKSLWWPTVDYTVTLCQRQQFYPHTIFAASFHLMRYQILTSPTFVYTESLYRRQKFYRHTLLYAHCQ